MEENYYLVVLAEDLPEDWIKRRLKGLRGFHNGFGFVFPAKEETFLRKVTKDLKVEFLRVPMGKGETFESVRRSYRISSLREKLALLENKLLEYRESFDKDKAASDLREFFSLLEEHTNLQCSLHTFDIQQQSLPSYKKLLCIEELLPDHNSYLGNYRGKEFIGLKQVTLPTLDALTLGIRKNCLLAAAPNVGKTALTIQLGLDVLKHNSEACVLYLSLEMSTPHLLSRIRCALAQLDWEVFVLGSGRGETIFTHEEIQQIEKGDGAFKELGKRFYVITERDLPEFTAENILQMILVLKQRSCCQRVFVILDYLQVIPIPGRFLKTIKSEIDADKWRIGQLKLLSEYLGDDPILSISEARKPDKSGIWASEISDVMGSARSLYTPDAIFLHRSILERENVEFLIGKDAELSSNEIDRIVEHYSRLHCDLQQVVLCKGRDGMKRGSFFLKFFYKKNIFHEISQENLKKELHEVLFGKYSYCESDFF